MHGICNQCPNIDRETVYLATNQERSCFIINVIAVVVSLVNIGLQAAVLAIVGVGIVYVALVVWTQVASFLLACVAMYNLIHLCSSLKTHREERRILHERIQSLENTERTLNGDLQEQNIAMQHCREEREAELQIIQELEEKYVQDLHQLEVEKQQLKQQVDVLQSEVANLSQTLQDEAAILSQALESGLDNASIMVEVLSDDDSWFEAIDSQVSSTEEINMEDAEADVEDNLEESNGTESSSHKSEVSR
ncbi:hypothetical protein [Chlamydia vaughanii]|uniref:hypothetical protein n=1 Tax=Chlamydia vaughanii TaxID=3112552 RepID=UPI0032B1F9DF